MRRPPTTLRRRLLVLVVFAALLALAGCSTPAPQASNAVPPPATVDADPLVWAALGGSESVAFDPATATDAWMHVVFSQLPESSQLVDVATPDATVSSALESQLVALQASPTVPTVATLWFGAADRTSSSTSYRSALKELIDVLRQRGVSQIVVVSRTDPGVGGRAADNQAVAAEQGAELVTIEAPEGDPSSASFQAAIAAQIAPAVS